MVKVCVNVIGADNLTMGKRYEIKKATHSDYVKVKNDNGKDKCYHKMRFAAE